MLFMCDGEMIGLALYFPWAPSRIDLSLRVYANAGHTCRNIRRRSCCNIMP